MEIGEKTGSGSNVVRMFPRIAYALAMPTMSRCFSALICLRGLALAFVLGSVASATCLDAGAQAAGGSNVKGRTAVPKSFDGAADAALLAMRRRAGELKVSGVAVVAYFEGESIQSWSSKMEVVGRLKDEPSGTEKGSNLLAIAYAKASEMADTLKDSGSHIRPPMTGEVGWSGGVILRGKTGYVIAAFSGGKSEDDVEVSRAGVKELVTGL